MIDPRYLNQVTCGVVWYVMTNIPESKIIMYYDYKTTLNMNHVVSAAYVSIEVNR